MFEQARRGQEWLEFLAPEPAVPAHLLDRILAETGRGKQEIGKLAVAGGADVLTMPPVWQRPGFAARLRRFAEPRLLMTAAMAFFSIALTLSITGVRISGMKMADLRPAVVRSALEKRIMTASTPLIRYYDHLRFVYEVESRVRELKRDVAPAVRPAKDATPEKKDHKDDTTQRPEQKEDRNYSQMESQFVLAKALVGSGIRNGCIGGFINDRFIGNTQIRNTQIENKKTEDLAVADLAVADLAVADLALDDPSVVSPSTHRRLV